MKRDNMIAVIAERDVDNICPEKMRVAQNTDGSYLVQSLSARPGAGWVTQKEYNSLQAALDDMEGWY